MTVQLNHTIVPAKDKHASARFLAEILGLEPPTRFGPFMEVAVDNAITLDFDETDDEIRPGHYAFLVGEEDFDAIFGRIRQRGVPYWADPGQRLQDQINHNDGGRGVYFPDPDGHLLEILTRPYTKS